MVGVWQERELGWAEEKREFESHILWGRLMVGIWQDSLDDKEGNDSYIFWGQKWWVYGKRGNLGG